MPGFASKLSRKLLGILASLLIAYGFGEILTRLFVPDPAFRRENRIEMWQSDPLVGYKNKPNFHEYVWGFVPLSTNSMGYRGHEVAAPKPPGTYRIMALGDSITWGVGVKDSDTYSAALEQLLNQQEAQKAGVHFEVVNTGVGGYSTHQERLTFERDHRMLCPDLVTLGYTSNDFYPTEDPFWNVRTFHQPAKDNVQRSGDYPPVIHPRLQFFWFFRSMVKKVYGQHNLREAAALTPPLQHAFPPGSFEDRSWPVLVGHMQAMKKLADQLGIPFVVLLFPAYPQVLSAEPSPFPQSRMAADLEKAGIDSINLYNAFRGQREGLFVDWLHLSPWGNRMTAEQILHRMEQKDWLPHSSASLKTCGSSEAGRAGPSAASASVR
ncbi:MAG: SGNH/GDSL hydrolase family protein [Acidobacteria bacterium]|nr:SGNH/GDSL hydrolase family protein [Acidobacteriota bacterium]MBI3484285.1 SGNH/GDSL hydrolase family protein [Acidobacteriota bacterium]